MTYVATAVQLALEPSFDASGRFETERRWRNVAHTEDVLRALAATTGSRLYVLPEFSFQGWALGVTVDAWNAASVRIPGPETDRIGALARELNAYVAGTLFERLDEFPGRHFLTGFVISPDGDVILKYRKLYAFSAKTRPGDVYRRYVDCFGADSLFPVVETPIGRLGMAIAWDANWPEVTRALAMRGAEVILHPLGSGRMPGEEAKGFGAMRRTRAFENVAYFVSANFGPLAGQAPETAGRWPSEICDYEGRVLAASDGGGETAVSATIDLDALRAHRAKPLRNWLVQLQTELHVPEYAAAKLWPLSQWEDRPIADARESFEVEARVWAGLCDSGRFGPPRNDGAG
jgi:predicted amidohydrolase